MVYTVPIAPRVRNTAWGKKKNKNHH